MQDSWNIDATLLHLYTQSGECDYVVQVNNTNTETYQLRLKADSDTNIVRLENCTIYLHNGSGISQQIIINDGIYSQDVGSWYTLSALSGDYIALCITINSTGTSTIQSTLEIVVPDSGVTMYYPINFEIT